MKKNRLFGGALLSVLVLIAASCSDDEQLPSSSGKSVTIEVNSTIGTIGDNTSRASLADDGVTPNWEENDQIAVKVDNEESSNFTLTSGSGSANAKFSGTVTIGDSPANMYFYYPASAADAEGVDLTKQDGSHTKEMVMFATCAYNEKPTFTFGNKTSILKLNIPVPEGSEWSASTTNLTATILGAYSKGKLNAEGNWSNLEAKGIAISDVKVSSDGKITGYAVVIPGSPVTDLRIAITDGSKCYVTDAYTKADATIPVNKVITISRTASKALVWTSSITKDNVADFLGNATDLTIVAADQMGTDDFATLKSALADKSEGTINLTLLNQESLPVSNNTGAFQNCTALKSVSLPQATSVGMGAFNNCTALKSVSLPQATSVGMYAFDKCTALTTVSLPQATSVGYNAFNNCESLTTISLPQATSVGLFAFGYCTSLTTVSLPQAESVSDFAFGYCTSLTTVSLPQAESMGDYAFDGCTTKNIALTVSPTATWYGNKSQWKAVYIGKFMEWTPGTQAADVTSTLGEGKDLIISANSEMVNADFTTLKSALYGKTDINLTLLTQQSLPASDDGYTGAFQNCTALKSVSLPLAETVGNNTFYNCTNLTAVYLPLATDVSGYAFDGCTTKNISLTVKAGTDWWKTDKYSEDCWMSVTQVPYLGTNTPPMFEMSDEWN